MSAGKLDGRGEEVSPSAVKPIASKNMPVIPINIELSLRANTPTVYNHSYTMNGMDQRELVRQLEAHFRAEDEKLHDLMRKSRQEQDALSDEEWWARIVSDTRGIRPEMLEIFERNKDEMIKNRPKRIGSEEGFREKNIQRQVMELLPYVATYRAETGAIGDVTDEEIFVATHRKSSEFGKSYLGKSEEAKGKVQNPKMRAMMELHIEETKAQISEIELYVSPHNLTEEIWEEQSKRIKDRTNKFLDRFQEITQRNPEELN